MSPVVAALLIRSAVLFLLLGSVAGLMVGALLLWNPQRLRAVGNVLNRWVSSRQLNHALDRTFEVEPWFYRYRRFSGGAILVAASYILYAFTFGLDRASIIPGFAARFNLPPVLAGGLLDALALCALSGASFAVFVSLFLILRPSQLREFEQSANRWVSLRRGLKTVEVPRAGVDEYVFRFGRQIGIMLILGSLYTLAFLTFWLSQTS